LSYTSTSTRDGEEAVDVACLGNAELDREGAVDVAYLGNVELDGDREEKKIRMRYMPLDKNEVMWSKRCFRPWLPHVAFEFFLAIA
jgi:hypothetical protein